MFEKEVRALGRSDLDTEVSYLNGEVVARGTKGSVRLDVIEGPIGSPTAIYDRQDGECNSDDYANRPNSGEPAEPERAGAGDPAMKATEWAQMSAPLAAALPKFQRMRFGVFRTLDWNVQGYLAESHSHDRQIFYINAFVMPRFIPSEGHINLTYGYRVGFRHTSVDDNLVAEVVARQSELDWRASLSGLRETTQPSTVLIRLAELHACISILQHDGAAFADSSAMIRAHVPHAGWQQLVRDRAVALVELVEAHGFTAGIQKMRERRASVDRLFVAR